jgi:hypothetical protein
MADRADPLQGTLDPGSLYPALSRAIDLVFNRTGQEG